MARTSSIFLSILWVLLLLSLAADGRAQSRETVRILDDFGNDQSTSPWTAKSGGGVRCDLRIVEGIPGAEQGVLGAHVSAPTAPAEGPRWFNVTRPVGKPIEPGSGDGLAIRLAVERPGRWWLAAHIEADGKGFSKAFQPIEFTEEFETRLIPFDLFTKKGDPKLDPATVTAVGVGGSGTPDNTLYIDSIAIYKATSMEHPVLFRTNHLDLALFEPGQPVELRFTVADSAPPSASSLEMHVRDYFDKTVRQHAFVLQPGKHDYMTVFQPESPGYYEVEAHWLNAAGIRLGANSCIRPMGSLKRGCGTFAVMPKTLQQNEDRMARLGERSFFGLHGDHSLDDGPKLSDYIGAAWGISGSSRWSWDEKEGRPDRSSGMAPWAREAMADATSQAPKLCLNNLNISHDIPPWAKSTTPDKAPGFEWHDFEAYLRDYISLRKVRYPHMQRRLYDVGWETNLNRPLTGIHKPEYRPEDVIDLYRHTKRILDELDPGALLVGPCVSSYITDGDWLTPLFDGGLLDLLDGFNCHGYHTPPPERSGIVEKTRLLRKQLADYAPGRNLPLICSELGYRSQYGTTDRHREHACWHVRTSIILKGEGFDAYMPFYSYDFPGDNSTWGICYNLDDKLRWGPRAGLSPKAATPALAVCIDQLEGTRPICDLRIFGRDIWGYVFVREKTPVLCLWSTGIERALELPAGDTEVLAITDIMGRTRQAPVKNGVATVRIGPAPIYVRGIDRDIYVADASVEARVIGSIYSGQSATLPARGFSSVDTVGVVGPVSASATGKNTIQASIPETVVPGAFPLRITGTDAEGRERQSTVWLVIPEPIEILGVGPILLDTRPGARVRVRNRGSLPEVLRLTARAPGVVKNMPDIQVPGNADVDVDIPLGELESVDPAQLLPLRLEISGSHIADSVVERRLCFLGARPQTDIKANRQMLPSQLTWSGKGSSGTVDKAQASFEWSDSALRVDVLVTDDVFHQTKTDGTVWREDGIQIAFDTHPELEALYEPLASIFTKKITQLSVAGTTKGILVWRDRTHNAGELPAGDVTSDVQASVTRNEEERTTTYRLNIPWQQLGLDRPRPGKALGIAILVNDSDGPGTPRRGIELFSGIMRGQNHTLYGSIILQ